MTDEKPAENPVQKDEVLAHLERMLESLPENSRQPIRDLINKRKVELGLMQSGLPPAGYKLKKRRKKAEPKAPSKETVEALSRIAKAVGKVKETEEVAPRDVDVKDEPLRKDRKVQEDVNSYKY